MTSSKKRWIFAALVLLLLLLLLLFFTAIRIDPTAGQAARISLSLRPASGSEGGRSLASITLAIFNSYVEDLRLSLYEEGEQEGGSQAPQLPPAPTATDQNAEEDPSPVPTDTAAPSATVTPTDTPGTTSTATPDLTNTPTPTSTQTATDTPEPTSTPKSKVKAAPKPTETPTPNSSTMTPAATNTPEPPTATPSNTPTPSTTPTPSDTPTPTATNTPFLSADSKPPSIVDYTIDVTSSGTCELTVDVSNFHVYDEEHSEGIDDGDFDITGIVQAMYRLEGGSFKYSGQLIRDSGGFTSSSPPQAWDAIYSGTFTFTFSNLQASTSGGIHVLAKVVSQASTETPTPTPMATYTPTATPTATYTPTATPTPEPYTVEVWLMARDDAGRSTDTLATTATMPGSCGG